MLTASFLSATTAVVLLLNLGTSQGPSQGHICDPPELS